MEDVVRVHDQYYVRATSSLADDRTRVLKYGDTFAVLNRHGDIEGYAQLGLFHQGTRYLSRLTLQVNHKQPMLLSSAVQNDNTVLSVDLTNLDAAPESSAAAERGTIHVYRSKFLSAGVCHEKIRIMNYGVSAVHLAISFQFDGDFADIFEVRGTHRAARGDRLPDTATESSVTLTYRGLDHLLRRTAIEFEPTPQELSGRQAHFQFFLQPMEQSSVSVTVQCLTGEESPSNRSHIAAYDQIYKGNDRGHLSNCRLTTSNKRFNEWLQRSEADLQMLVRGNPEGPYPYAGVPWFNTVFGRDGIITALECLWMAPHIAETVLLTLAELQASEIIPAQDAEPGKILHEMRRGEMAALKEVPFGKYYGSVDATPLFVVLAGAYFARTANREFLSVIWPNIQRAIRWIDEYGDIDGDGFVEYARKSDDGLVQQGWKDSNDSVFHADGTLAQAPIALCEVQAYVYAAKHAAALLAAEMGDLAESKKLTREAQALKKKFENDFWNEDLGMFAIALDGKKRQCQVRSSNAGQTLFCGIATAKHAERISQSLMSQNMFSGWGIRTIGSGEARYNPMSYHNGSVWPHDNALIGLGLARYGYQQAAAKILGALYDVSKFVELRRLPELFCGFHNRHDSNGPTLYPVACAPQAWAAGSPFLLLAACLGLEVKAAEGQILFTNPTLPDRLEEVRIDNLRVGNATADLVIRRHGSDTAVSVSRKQGKVEVITSR